MYRMQVYSAARDRRCIGSGTSTAARTPARGDAAFRSRSRSAPIRRSPMPPPRRFRRSSTSSRSPDLLRGKPVELVRAKTRRPDGPGRGRVRARRLRRQRRPARSKGRSAITPASTAWPSRYPTFHITASRIAADPIYAGDRRRQAADGGRVARKGDGAHLLAAAADACCRKSSTMNLPVEGGFHNLAIVSIRKSYPGQAKKVMNALWGLGHMMMLTRVLVIVDADVDVQDPRGRRVVRAQQSRARTRRRDDARSGRRPRPRFVQHRPTEPRSASTPRAKMPRRDTRGSGRRTW